MGLRRGDPGQRAGDRDAGPALRRDHGGSAGAYALGSLPVQPDPPADINAQTEALLDAAAVPAPIVNWAGDEAVSVQEWTAYLAGLSGLPARLEVVSIPGTLRGSIADVSRRRALAGPCRVSWRDGVHTMWESRTGLRAISSPTG